MIDQVIDNNCQERPGAGSRKHWTALGEGGRLEDTYVSILRAGNSPSTGCSLPPTQPDGAQATRSLSQAIHQPRHTSTSISILVLLVTTTTTHTSYHHIARRRISHVVAATTTPSTTTRPRRAERQQRSPASRRGHCWCRCWCRCRCRWSPATAATATRRGGIRRVRAPRGPTAAHAQGHLAQGVPGAD